VKVEIEASRTRFVLRISDDGCGMPVTSANSESRSISSGVGISAMRARLRKLGATLEISASSEAENHGTTLSAVIPRARSRHSVRRRAGPCADKVMLI
jgi:two-component system NarL family sensor kinase/two-component system sensor histidine kinase UhpB